MSSGGVIKLKCVNDGKKLRIRIISYTDIDGKIFTGVYHNEYNCRFPRNLRILNKCFEVPEANVRLMGDGISKAFYYSISTKNIKEISLPDEKLDSAGIENIFKEEECVICMNNVVQYIFSQCGHACCCFDCGNKITKCCVCRKTIINKISLVLYEQKQENDVNKLTADLSLELEKISLSS
jgi:hypothetical protein